MACGDTVNAMISIAFTSVFVDDQAKALAFYTDIVGFTLCADIPMGEHRWLTVRSSEAPGAVELLLEPNVNPLASTFQAGLKAQGIPATAFSSTDVAADVERLKGLGVEITSEPKDIGPAIIAQFDDSCGNLIQLAQAK